MKQLLFAWCLLFLGVIAVAEKDRVPALVQDAGVQVATAKPDVLPRDREVQLALGAAFWRWLPQARGQM